MKKETLLLSFILTIILFSCNKDNCSSKLGFTLSYNLFDKINVNGDSYCSLVNKSLNLDEESILSMCKLKFNSGASYEHGAVIIEIIDKVSEEKFISIYRKLSITERKYLYNSIIFAGLEFTLNNKYKGFHISKAFPLLTTEFNKL